ncbi:MAG: molybdopterin-dependent oxidoreductase [Acidilobus sp.]
MSGVQGIIGCKAYLSRRLAQIGMPVVFECSSTDKLTSLDDVKAEALAGLRVLSELTESGGLMIIYSGHELIGRSFDLFSFRIVSGQSEVGNLRIVTRKSTFVNLTGVMFTNALPLLPAEGNLLMRGYVSSGEVMDRLMATRDCPSADVPVGQVTIPKFVIYSAEGEIPRIERGSWKLRLKGLDGDQVELSLAEVMELSRDLGDEDFHCVTGWSVRGRRYLGIPLKELLKGLSGLDEAKWVYSWSVSGYSSVMPTDVALDSAALIAGMDGKALPDENGGPARIFSPLLYGWKGTKWVTTIELLKDYEDGYWEALAYHERGLVSRNERFKIRNPLLTDLC